VNQPEPSAKPKQRRLTPRRKPKGGTRVSCRKGALGLGPNIAQALLDLSEGGIRLLVGTPLKTGQEVEVGLSGPSVAREITRLGEVIWSVETAGGNHCIGVQFVKRLDHATLRDLTQFATARVEPNAPAPAPAPAHAQGHG
jgi:hypothetical protein